jgi:putative phosphoribosyl transferase
VVRIASVSEKDLLAAESREAAEVERRAKQFRGDHPQIPFTGKTVVIVDDGIATGSTAKAACQIARARGARRVVLAVPVAPADWNERMVYDADELVCVEAPEQFLGVGQWYHDFSQTTDDEVLGCLIRLRTFAPADGTDGANAAEGNAFV